MRQNEGSPTENFPNTAGPVFRRYGLLLILIVALCGYVYFFDREEGAGDQGTVSTEQEQPIKRGPPPVPEPVAPEAAQ